MKFFFALPLIISYALLALEPAINEKNVAQIIKSSQHQRGAQKNVSLYRLIHNSPLGRAYPSVLDLDNRLIFAIKHFHGIPGFLSTLVNTLKQTDEGHFYEIETALSFMQLGKKIIAFNAIIKMPSRKREREFDIIMQNEDKSQVWVECKCNLSEKISKKHTKQFFEQKEIARIYAEKEGIPIYYIVCFRNATPDAWASWFSKNEIETCEYQTSYYDYASDSEYA